MFKITLKDDTFVNVEHEQAKMIVESLFEHISGIRLLEEDEVEARQALAERLAAKGISLDNCEAMGYQVEPGEDHHIYINIPNGSIYVEAWRDGDLVKMDGDFFNGNELMPISGGESLQELIQDAEDQKEYISDKYPEAENDVALLSKVIEDWKAIATPITEDAEPDLVNLDLETEEPDSTLVTECTTSGAVASVASPIGTPTDPIKKPKVKVKRI